MSQHYKDIYEAFPFHRHNPLIPLGQQKPVLLEPPRINVLEQNFMLDIAIPTFKEEKYIPTTLQELAKQTVFPHCTIYIADYDPDKTGTTKAAIAALNMGNVRVIDVDRPGIGIARKIATEAGTAPYVMTFDADARFARTDAMEMLMEPILAGNADAVRTLSFMETPTKPVSPMGAFIHDARNEVMKILPLASEPGFTFTRAAYNLSGGWGDVKWLEGPILSLMMVMAGLRVYMVEEAYVVVSTRRIAAGWDLDYGHAYRGDEMIETGDKRLFV